MTGLTKAIREDVIRVIAAHVVNAHEGLLKDDARGREFVAREVARHLADLHYSGWRPRPGEVFPIVNDLLDLAGAVQ